MSDPVQPHQVMAKGFPWIPVIAAGTILLGAFIWAAVQFGFFVDTANQHHQVKVKQIQASAYNNNIGVQQSDIQAMETAIGDIDESDPAHAAADARTACSWASKIISIPPGDKSWVAANCLAGNLSPSSKYGK